jgi:DNA-binding NarL/FixJ family response regulator
MMMTHRADTAIAPALRVALRLRDGARRNALAGVVSAASHDIVENTDDADVIVFDEAAEMRDSEAARAVVIGGSPRDAAALLPADANAAQIDAAIRAVAAGLTVRTAQTDNDGFGQELEISRPEILLTPRELQVLAAIAEGLGNKAIARRLDISLHTVKFHVEALFRKLGVRSRAEAVAKAWDRHRSAIDL